jgi:threonine/homoserine/homoserine lactone efflux protein
MELDSKYLFILLKLAALHLVAAISPGPSVILVAHTSAMRSRRAGMVAALAMGVGATIWAAGALFGLNLFFADRPTAFQCLRAVGAIFLFWTGLKMLLAAKKPISTANSSSSQHSIFIEALRLQLSNPKVMIFFSSIFLVALPIDAPLWFRFVTLTVILLDETIWYSFLAFCLALPAAQERFINMRVWISSICGLFLSVCGAKLLIDAFTP